MLPMKHREAAQGVLIHSEIRPRIYEQEWPHDLRIRKSREYVAQALGSIKGQRIAEVGCGTADISGPFAEEHSVLALDCNLAALEEAKRRFPNIIPLEADISSHEPLGEGDLVILCETLEHLPNPEEMAVRWLSKSAKSVISHPLNEPLDSGLSGGEHQWSFSLSDFEHWFHVGGHEVQGFETFKMGCYEIILGWGKRK